ncbi:MAG: sulfatase [Chthoniobacteraceae bacterium]
MIRLAFFLALALSLRAAEKPNIVLIFCDDLGYADVACFGAKTIRTPHIDRLAKEGTRFTSFLVAQAVCTASRAALMTGSYANRVGLAGALNHTSKTGINPDETLLPELCKAQGYATGMFGKWHLGDQPPFLPTRNGFDEWLGIPYSNDNGPLHPVIRDIPSLPLYDGEKIVERDPDQAHFTRRLTERSVAFIEKNRERPFFLYVPHIMPHVPIFASEKFRGKSKHGLYADVVEELDRSVGEIAAAIDRAGLREKTLILFTSDNGPFLSYGEHAGAALPFREGKLTTFEGGVRVPFIARWPGRVPAGRTSDELLASIDLLPTFARLIGAPLPATKMDGMDAWTLISGDTAKSPRDTFLYYSGDELQAVRRGKWKLHFPHDYLTTAAEPGRGGKPSNWANMKPKSITESGIRGIASRHGYRVERIEKSLFELTADPGETKNVAAEHPDIVAELEALAESARADLGDALTQRTGANLRLVGRVP